MKTNKFYTNFVIALLCVFSLGFVACDDDDDPKVEAPVIEIEEANIEGDELCVEADIVAMGRTASITINICDATGNTIKVPYTVTSSKYIGVLNVDGFHVHVPIEGKDVVVGDQLKLTVADALGQTTTATKNITEEEDEDEEHDHD